MPLPPSLRRGVRCDETSACVCNSSSRSPSGSSWSPKISVPDHSSRLSVPPNSRKNKRLVSMCSSYSNVRDLPNDENPDDLGNDRVREKLAPGRVGPQQTDVLGLQEI